MCAIHTPKLEPVAFKSTLAALLKTNRRIEFIANPGNGGDSLINAGAWQVFEELGVAKDVRRPTHGSSASVYVYPGGGNLIPSYDDARRVIESRMSVPFERFIILPHTIRGHEDLLRRWDDRFHVFCRDLETRKHLKANAPTSNLYLADDLALLLDLRWLLSPERRAVRRISLLRNPRFLRRYCRWRLAISRVRPIDGVLKVLRVDVEAVGHQEADPRMDLSALYGSFFDVRGEPELIAADFVEVLDRAHTVVTDRLHVGIGASLLGKRVLLLDNNYGKNRALFDMSMKGRFPATEFLQAGAE